MTITTTPELLAADEQSEEQRRRICGAAANIMLKCGELIPRPFRADMFAFASNLLLKASKVEEETSASEAVGAQPKYQVSPLVELGQTERELEADRISQIMLSRLSSNRVTEEIVNYARKGSEFAAEVTSYALNLGGSAFEVVRVRPMSDPAEPISYTLHSLHAEEDRD